VLFGALAAVAIPGEDARAAAPSACRLVQMAELDADLTGHQLHVAGEINGQPARIMIDSSGNASMIWRPSAKRYGLHLRDASQVRFVGVGGESYVQQAEVETLKIGSFEAHKITLPVAGEAEWTTDMILGVNFFAAVAIEFDLPHRKVRLLQGPGCTPPQFAYWARTFAEVDLTSKPADSGAFHLKVQLNGQDVDAILDSGAAISTVSVEDAARVGVTHSDAEPGSDHAVSGIGPATVEGWTGAFDSFAIGAEAIRHTHLRVANLQKNLKDVRVGSRLARQVYRMTPMIIGVDFLLSHRVIVVSPERKMYFTYEGGPVFQTMAPPAPASAPSPDP
jgi:predicted aspartyl protease